MPKRSITDDEIALIKAMLKRGMENKVIQFFFNHPKRAVNSGRISGIRSGSYSNSASIAEAPEAVLDSFIERHSISENIISSSAATEGEKLIYEAPIEKLFTKGSDGLWRLTGGETDRFECKTNFGFRHQDKWLRAIAALANNVGGIIFFGVYDKDEKGPDNEDLSYVACGLGNNEFLETDPAEFATRVKSIFDPTPAFRIGSILLNGKIVGFIQVDPHQSRPIIATKQEGSIREGDIFYRYPGQSSRIKYSDLRAILDARDAEVRQQILPMIEHLLRLGPMRAMIADLEDGKLEDGKRSIQIDTSLVDKLTFIKEGEFHEKDGAPTLRLIGDVHTINANDGIKTKLSLLTRDDILSAFLGQAKIDHPLEYIRFVVEVSRNERLPLHYFAKQAGLSKLQAIDFIQKSNGSAPRKKACIGWLDEDAAFRAATGNPKRLLEGILKGDIPDLPSPKEASHTAQALTGLPRGAAFNKDEILRLLRKCCEMADVPSMSFVRRGICRVDEILFSIT
ncbi:MULTISPECIES: ATP-binding protein [unclassified Chelatococcus]|uniref:AlbA family DNA-binding domain-containing protein n=1 Tax=unclassified Chelatococcus TaxID=2638111 RepID=UPI001BCC29F0|nr:MULTISPECIES: ATP-binding protein [unclassified Chelatococcus]CAH1650368.1 AlbA_2 domain-containing protein [Hyphomicrobiales bacterium]MBS7743316.1 ATP-binding protein [Chelatococcus sp. HY11]MBX3541566.1 ATP-binding protein [Chelatococcus sp.]MCO5074542.1 ATP-binding protein [Chelatococcus sp.]CAH1692614.1 AlbA_2 domain-containing protein [Hyphomicrobiales bacterium]